MSHRAWSLDLGIALAVTAAELTLLLDDGAASLAAMLATITAGGAVAVRRLAPPAVLAVTLMAAGVIVAVGEAPSGLSVLIALGTVGAMCERRVSLPALATTVLAVTALMAVTAERGGRPSSVVVGALAAGPLAAGVWGIGAYLRAQRSYRDGLRLRADMLARDREQLARIAVHEERAAIARELHDIVAHSVGVMLIGVRGARDVLHHTPDVADATLADVEDTGERSITELQRILTLLRDPHASTAASAAVARRPPTPRRRAPRHRPARRSGAAGATRPATGRDRAVRVPDHPGGAHQRTPAHRPDARHRAARLPRGGPRGDRERRRRHARRAGNRPRTDRNARTGRPARWRPRRRPGTGRRLPGRRTAPDPGTGMTIRVLLVDDQELVRTGLRLLLGTQPELEVVGEAGDGAAALTAARELRPNIVLMDIRMPDVDGIEATARIAAAELEPPPRIIALTTFDLDEYVFGAIRAGAAGFLLKHASRAQLMDAIHTVHAGDSLLSPSITRRLIEHVATSAAPRAAPTTVLAQLTPREREMLTLIARGLSNTEIADRLVISEATVKSHVGAVLAKLRLRDRVHAVVFAYEHGIVVPGEQA